MSLFLSVHVGFRPGGTTASGNRKRDAHRKRAGRKTSGSAGTYFFAATGGLWKITSQNVNLEFG